MCLILFIALKVLYKGRQNNYSHFTCGKTKAPGGHRITHGYSASQSCSQKYSLGHLSASLVLHKRN